MIMTSDELHAICDHLGWTMLDLSKKIHRSYSRAKKWGRGSYPIEPPVAEWLRDLRAAFDAGDEARCDHLLDHPPPPPPAPT
jgi:hypothetical protein